MKLSKRILACAITAAMATSMLSACNGSTTTSGSASDARYIAGQFKHDRKQQQR